MLARLRSAVVLGVALAPLVATAAASPIVPPPPVETILSGGPSPARLPAREPAPVSLLLAERVQTPDGSHPPALQRLEVELDRHFAIELKRLPSCHPGLQEQRMTLAEQCGPAQVGAGTLDVEVAFPEQPASEVEGELQVFNGGTVRGTTTFWLYTYLPRPITSGFLMRLRFRHHRDGRYGLQGTLDGSRIADGAGSITYLAARFRKGIFRASCPDGRLQEQARSFLATGAIQSAELIDNCTRRR